MIRSKILGQEHFNRTAIDRPANVNSDIGHFSIGHGELTPTAFEDIPIPPKHLWIRAKVSFDLCPETPVLRGSNSFVWLGSGRCKSVKLEAVQLLYAQKEYEVDRCWALNKEQSVFEHRFAVAPTLYSSDSGIHLWPCGGGVVSFPRIEQLFAQVPVEGEQVYVNSLNTWKKYLVDGDDIMFEPPHLQEMPLIDAIARGKFLSCIKQSGLEYTFSSCRIENTDAPEFIDILFERNDL